MSFERPQQLFWDAVTGQRDVSAQEIEEVFVSSPELPASKRLDIYRNMYFWRIVDVLRQDFPKISQILGEDAFADLVRSYLRAYPSSHFSIAKVGQELATHLRRLPLDGARPDLADLAELEWARSQVFDAEDGGAGTAASLAGLDPRTLQEHRFTFVPAFRLIELEYAVASLWLALDTGEPLPAPNRQESAIAVWRRGFDVLHAVLEPVAAEALTQALGGAAFAKVCEAFADAPDDVAIAFATIGSWFADEWIASDDNGTHSASSRNLFAHVDESGDRQ